MVLILPHLQFRSKNYDMFYSFLDNLVHKYEKALSSSNLSKPSDRLRPSQSVWSIKENLHRNASRVLGTTEHFVTAAAPVLKNSIPECKPCLVQVDKAWSYYYGFYRKLHLIQKI